MLMLICLLKGMLRQLVENLLVSILSYHLRMGLYVGSNYMIVLLTIIFSLLYNSVHC